MSVFDDFVTANQGTYVYIPGYNTPECVALFWLWNTQHGAEPYSAPGAAQLWEQPPGVPYLWDHYDRVEGPFQDGDWLIWSGDPAVSAYPNQGEGHIAMAYHGQFFSQNPNAPQVMSLDTTGVMGALRPKASILPQASNVTPITEDTMNEQQAEQLAYVASAKFKVDLWTVTDGPEADARNAFINAVAQAVIAQIHATGAPAELVYKLQS